MLYRSVLCCARRAMEDETIDVFVVREHGVFTTTINKKDVMKTNDYGSFLRALEVDSDALPEQTTCAICMNDINRRDGDSIVSLPCNHVFHATCLWGWVQECCNHSRCTTCPLCNTVAYAPIYAQKTHNARPQRPQRRCCVLM